jgi:hypothetical protein
VRGFTVFAYYNTVKSNVLRETGKKKNRIQALKTAWLCGLFVELVNGLEPSTY